MAFNSKSLHTRLQQARTVLGYSLSEVASGTFIHFDRLEAIEAGLALPSGDEVLILASFYDCNFRAFLDDSLQPPVEQSEILFRQYGAEFGPEDRRAVQEFLFLCEVESELERMLEVKKKNFSTRPTGNYYKGHGAQAAEQLRGFLKYQPIAVPMDVYDDFRSIGVHIFRRRLSNPNISGLFIQHSVAGACVLVNYDEDIYRQRFSVAHEVAHAIFDVNERVVLTSRDSKYSQDDLKEIRANSFASNFLMPLSMLQTISEWSPDSILLWAQKFKVSTSALVKALTDHKLIHKELAGVLKSKKLANINKVDPEAPENLTQLQKNRRLQMLERGISDYYVHLAFECYHRELISRGRLAEVLRLDVSELPETALVFGRSV